MNGINNESFFHYSMATASVGAAGSESTAATTTTATSTTTTPSTYQASESVPSSSR
jgi:hypothetical protein